MGRFTVLKKHTVLGMEGKPGGTVWMLPMSAIESSTFRHTIMATLLPAKAYGNRQDDPDATLEDLTAALEAARDAEEQQNEAQAAMVHAHTFDDESGNVPTFASPADVRNGLDASALEDLAMAILDASGYTAASREAARRFRDGAGEAGSVAGAPGGEGVRAASE